jgi:hypothetical protein
VLQLPEVSRQLGELGVRSQAMTPEQFAEFGRVEWVKYRDIARRTGVRLEQ